MISFDTFSGLVDEALEELKKLMEDNKDIEKIIIKGDK